MAYLGVDIGTSGCKALAFNDDGRELAAAYREYDLIFTPDGGAELDSELVMTRCLEVIREVATALPGEAIRALAISSQGEAFTAVDANGRALCNGMVSSDLRSLPYVAPWTERLGRDWLYRITGQTAHPMYTLFKLLWLKENRPAVWNAAARFLCYEDLLQLRLGVEPTMAWPLAGRTMLFNLARHCWDPDILAATGISADRLSRPLPSGTVVGKVRAETARDLGLTPDTRVVTGGHDQPCGALGAGVTESGRAMFVTGTVDCISPAFAAPVFTDSLRDNNLCTYDHTVPGMYTSVAFNLTGGNLLKWARGLFGGIEEAPDTVYSRLLAEAGDRPSRLMTLPYFAPSGTPYFESHPGGAILGLRLDAGRGELIRGLLEGTAMEMRLNLEIMAASGWKIEELRLIGGGARSAIWNQLKADVIGKSMCVPDVTEAGCLGCAMLACAADTGASVRELADSWVRSAMNILPRPELQDWYDARFAVYRELYPTLREWNHKLTETALPPLPNDNSGID